MRIILAVFHLIRLPASSQIPVHGLLPLPHANPFRVGGLRLPLGRPTGL